MKTATIVKAPHPSLRKKAKPVTTVDAKTIEIINKLGATLQANETKGVGLAATQIDKNWRAYATYLSPNDENDETQRQLNIYINPVITSYSDKFTLGDDPEYPILEGCLSIPGIFGPVPRAEWIEISYQIIKDGRLVEKNTRFDGFQARLSQHEIDHLDGILFTDYTLKYDLPLYRDNQKTKKLQEMTDLRLIETF